ncbi:Hypothetical protein POVN_LOCUS624 [uncultured virus]|nr:Hypothetical protein POVN_LOCUS624 [uncultured virus]
MNALQFLETLSKSLNRLQTVEDHEYAAQLYDWVASNSFDNLRTELLTFLKAKKEIKVVELSVALSRTLGEPIPIRVNKATTVGQVKKGLAEKYGAPVEEQIISDSTRDLPDTALIYDAFTKDGKMNQVYYSLVQHSLPIQVSGKTLTLDKVTIDTTVKDLKELMEGITKYPSKLQHLYYDNGSSGYQELSNDVIILATWQGLNRPTLIMGGTAPA